MLKNVMCDILQAKILSVVFYQQKNGVYREVSRSKCVYILPSISASMNRPNPTCGQPSEGVGRER